MSPVNSTNMILNNRLRGLETTLRSAQNSLSVSERMSALDILAIPTRPSSEGPQSALHVEMYMPQHQTLSL